MRLPIQPFLPPLARRLLAGDQPELLRPLALVADAAAVATRCGASTLDRRTLADALAVENVRYGHPRAGELAAALARPETLVVATGQQPGLFGGPLYTLVKAAAAARWASALTAATGRPAVAVFWIASDDHDFSEIGRAFLPASGVDPSVAALVLSAREPRTPEPVGTLALGPEPQSFLAQLRTACSSERYRAWLERLAAIYAPAATFTDAFAHLLAEVLGRDCPLLLDAALPAVRRLQAPLLARMLERERELEAALAERELALDARGLTPAVRPQPGCPPVFVLERGRRLRLRRCEAARPEYELRGGELRAPLEEWLRLLEREPELFSPSVLSRPLVQDALLGTALFLVGPGELSYLAQASALYEPAGVAPSAVALRPQAVLVDARRFAQLEELAARGLPLERLLADDVSFDAALATLAGDEDPLEAEAGALLRTVEDLGRAALAVDPQLSVPWTKTREQVERAVETLHGKARAALARRDEETRRRALALREILRPQGRLQERVVATAHAVGVFGQELARTLRERLELDGSALQVLCVAEPTEASLRLEPATREAGA